MTLKRASFLRVNLVTILAVYLLIFIGGLVRNLDSGMGCPDWPKCFGSVLPPSGEEDLPGDYREQFKKARLEKNARLAGYLEFMGFSRLSMKLKSEQAEIETEYDFVKAWIEYANRIVGVLIGFLIILNMIWSFAIKSKAVRTLGILVFLLVLIQGWIGSIVVSTNLLPGFITFHMFLAVLLVLLLILQRNVGEEKGYEIRMDVLSVLFLSFFVQVFLGTWVREQVDFMNASGIQKSEWVLGLDFWFYVHRSFSIIVLILTAFLVYSNRSLLKNSTFALFVLFVVLEVMLGVSMTYFQFPILTQPLHLLLGTASLGILFYLLLKTDNSKVTNAIS